MNSEDGTENPDVLDIMLSHLEPGREQHPSSDFSFKEREIHEKRVPILLLDWARTIMLDEWQGRPDVPGDGAFGGALALVAAMREFPMIHLCASKTAYIYHRPKTKVATAGRCHLPHRIFRRSSGFHRNACHLATVRFYEASGTSARLPLHVPELIACVLLSSHQLFSHESVV